MIHLDHNATCPLDPSVLEAMLPWLRERFGNASSRDHALGWDAAEVVEEARAQVAALVGAGHHEILFTSGATESAALALHGLFPTEDGRGLALTAVEHEAVRGTARALELRGVPVDAIGVDARGAPDVDRLDGVLHDHRPALVCAMAANNETGVLFPIAAVAAKAHAHGARLFVDAAQALGRMPVNFGSGPGGWEADFAALSAHKMGGPKGVGALYLRGGPEAAKAAGLRSLYGGGQEGGLRAGTLNVPAIVGFGEACRLAASDLQEEAMRLRALRDRFEKEILSAWPGVRVNGDRDHRLPQTSNLLFPGIEARTFLRRLPGIAAATRSACSSGSSEPSHVLKAMGLTDSDALASIRFSLGRTTTPADVDAAVAAIVRAYRADPGARRTGPDSPL